jgi:hypothetical protein
MLVCSQLILPDKNATLLARTWTITSKLEDKETHEHLFPMCIMNSTGTIPHEANTIELDDSFARSGILGVLLKAGSLMHDPNSKLWVSFIAY